MNLALMIMRFSFAGDVSEGEAIEELYDMQMKNIHEADAVLSRCVGALRDSMLTIIRRKRQLSESSMYRD